MLARGYTRETALRRDRSGKWFDGELALTHGNLCESFDRWIDRAPDGRFCLHNDINWAYVQLEGAPYVVRSVRFEGQEPAEITLLLTGGRQEALDPSSLRVAPDESLWCDVREGRVPARFDNHAALQLAPLLGEDDQGPYLMLAGEPIRPTPVEDPMLGWTPEKGHVT